MSLISLRDEWRAWLNGWPDTLPSDGPSKGGLDHLGEPRVFFDEFLGDRALTIRGEMR